MYHSLVIRRFHFVLVLTLLLAACGGGSGSASVACDQEYWDGVFGTCLPEAWIVVNRETLRQRGVPEDVFVAFQAEEPSAAQFPTVTVTREALADPVTPVDYSSASIRSVGVLPGYELLDTRSLTMDEQDLSLHVFSAQPVESEPRRRFYQVSTVHGEIGYTVTGTGPLSIDDETESALLLILQNATFVEPQIEE